MAKTHLKVSGVDARNSGQDQFENRRWKIRNRFVGFIALLLLALLCLISPKAIEYGFNSVGAKK